MTYLKRVLLAASALTATPVAAQEWTVGDQGVNWDVLSTKPTGPMPVDTYEPADPGLPPGVDIDDWNMAVADQQGDAASGLSFIKGATREKKIRILCEPAPVKTKDNILGKGIKQFGHPHLGSGLVDWDENTTFQTARANPRSTCAGGPLIAANYMEPAFLKQLASGAIVAVLQDAQVNYYVLGIQSEPNHARPISAGMQFLMGANPRNMNDTARRATYEASGFAYPGGINFSAGQLGYSCSAGDGTPAAATGDARLHYNHGERSPDKVAYLRGPNGEDPFGGTCVAVGGVPATLVSNLLAPGCHDGVNLTASDGRGHFWYAARKGDNSIVNACPTTTAGASYPKVPELEVKNFFLTAGFADYGSWWLDSDRMDPAMTVTAGSANDPVTQGDPASISPCRRAGPYFCNGETLHADYTFGHHVPVFDQMQRECLGIPVRGIAPVDGPAECNTNVVDRYHSLRTGPTPAPLNEWIGRDCTNVGQCYDSSPSNPAGRYRTIPGFEPGTVNIHSGHGEGS